MSIKTAYSEDRAVDKAVNEVKQQLSAINPNMVLYFASSIYNPDELSAKMQAAFGDALTYGCSTAGEIVSGKVLKNSVVAMGFDVQAMGDAKVVVLTKVKEGNPVKQAFEPVEKHFGASMMDLDPRQYVGIILADGLSGMEEKVMDQIGNLTNITFIGGSAGDDLQFKKTFVYAGGKAYTDAVVLAVLKPKVQFDTIKTQSFKDLKKKLTATRVNEAAREVVEFDGKPAAQAYAEALGTPVDKASEKFMHNPVGLMDGDEPYVRSPQQVKGSSMVFYCNIKEGMELDLLESTDIVRDTKAAVDAKVKEMGGISGIINFHCILRTLDLDATKQTEPYGKIFTDIPTIGFSTYGEEFIGHINQTSTMLVFK